MGEEGDNKEIKQFARNKVSSWIWGVKFSPSETNTIIAKPRQKPLLIFFKWLYKIESWLFQSQVPQESRDHPK